ncbi:THAP domain-containing protein 2-like [Limanda limanda]|uniref:THAP domain-containing protein 2-like n=1 Tax=Limanda limanda TaxID=27771 RepID=UPI0029C77CBB|nr:THAP domain-containing protein 2-like [Limanda limanda]
MPSFCAAYGCSNTRSLETRTRGITFHQFPKTGERRRMWEVALRGDRFAASDRTTLCSEHFRSEDFDRTGQTVRLRDGAVPTILTFQGVCGATGERRLERKRQATDHFYAWPASPKAIKAKLEEASARVRKLQREKTNAFRRENRAKNNMQALLEKLKEKNLINEELKDKLECYSDHPVHLLSRQGVEYTKAQRDFALTLHLHGPKAYHYLRDTLHIHLPHPSSLQNYSS